MVVASSFIHVSHCVDVPSVTGQGGKEAHRTSEWWSNRCGLHKDISLELRPQLGGMYVMVCAGVCWCVMVGVMVCVMV